MNWLKFKEWNLIQFLKFKNLLKKIILNYFIGATFEVVLYSLAIYLFQFFFTNSFNYKFLLASVGCYFIAEEIFDKFNKHIKRS